jgi:adenine-specific DNA-methyltransferase
MPTLTWIGKEKVINHHLDVPYKILEHQYGFDNGKQSKTKANSGNKIIHGDNLEALKSLLPEYEGRVKCIYIDPPYNTGEEGWVYNDNVNDPKIKKWLDKVVGKEGDDLTRHDKWLCMMYPRLSLLNKLLDSEGLIFISIDDYEVFNLKLICDEIFAKGNFIGQFVWKRRASSQLSQNNVSVDHEYVLCYSKTKNFIFKGTEKDYKNYKNPDNDPNGPWTLGDLTVGMTKDQRPNQFYNLIDPSTNKVYKPNPSRVWSYIKESMDKLIQNDQIVFPEDTAKRPMLKRYLKNLKSNINPVSTWIDSKNAKSLGETTVLKTGLNTEGTKEIQKIFGQKSFDYSKPVSLVEALIGQVTIDGDIILDSFSGSGTTAHAVLNLNKQDGGTRKFILIEMEDYANDITAERVKRVIKGYGEENKAVEGTSGSFDYYELGKPLFIEENILNEEVEIEKILEYIWYSETKSSFHSADRELNPNDNSYFLGKNKNTAYYFYYEKDRETTLDDTFLRKLKTKAEQYIIYADNCVLSRDIINKYHITFKKIPRDITRF